MSDRSRSHPYSELLRIPRVTTAYLAVSLSALPLGMINLAVVLTVQHWTGSLTVAAWLSGAFTLGNAAGLSLQGRLLDRFGPRRLIPGAGFLAAAALTTVVVTGANGAPPAVLGVSLVVAGVSVPAITTAVRAQLPRLLADTALRNAGYALLSVLFQVSVTVGPLLVSLSLVVTPSVALLTAGVLLCAAGLLATRPNGLLRQAPVARATGGAAPPARWTPGFVAVLVVGALTGTATGTVAVAVPGITSAVGLAALAGMIFSGIALGEVGGALIFGSRRWPLVPWAQLAVALLAGAALAATAYLVAPTPWVLLPVMAAGGLLAAPVPIVSSALLDRVLPATSIGRGYGLLVSVGLVAAAVGNTIAGSLASTLPPRQLLLAAPVLLLLAAATALVGLRIGPHR